MRAALVLCLAALAIAAPAAADEAAPSAQAAFVERRGMLEADAQCGLFTPAIRAALQAGAGQARGALLRGGWSVNRLAELEQAAIGAARARACGDPRTARAAEQARASFVSWTRLAAMDFNGGARRWTARRIADAQGWLLFQDAPGGARFGVREIDGRAQLCLALPARDNPPAGAQMLLRDPARAPRAQLDVPGRTARGLEAGAPAQATAQRFWASGRRIEIPSDGRRQLLFVFPDAAFEAMAPLDPREAAELRLGVEPGAPRLLIEVGDIAAARAFLAIRNED